MKQKTALITAIIFILSLAVPFVGVYADDGAEFELFYDFEGYKAEPGSGILPDNEYWSTTSSTSGNKLQFGSYTEDGNTAMKLLPWAGAILFFNRIAESGNLHISYDIKVSNPIFDVAMILDDGVTSQDPRFNGHSTLKYSRGPKFQTHSECIVYNNYSATSTDPGGLSVAWNYVQSDVEYKNTTEWHRFDMVTTDLSKADARVTYYIDGKKVNENPVYCAKAKGLKSFTLLPNLEKDPKTGESFKWTKDDFVIIDNVAVRRYFDDKGLRGTALNGAKTDLNNGELTVRLSERVNKDLITPENITIKGGVNSAEFTNFTVAANSDKVSKDGLCDTFTVKFNGDIDMGSYELMLNSSVTGEYLNLPMVTPVTFRTNPKTAPVDMDYLEENFNLYSDVETLPQGWRYQPERENTYHTKTQGKTEDALDYALAIVNPEEASSAVRFIKPFDISIQSGAEYTVSFDVLNENMYWYLYLLNQGDLDENNAGYDENTVLAARGGGKISYAKTRTNKSRDLIKINDALKTNSGEWNNVQLTVCPKADKTIYKIQINDLPLYEVEAQRDYMNNATAGLGFGYMPEDTESKLYIDNVSVLSNFDAIYPEVDTIEYFNCNNEKLVAGSGITSALHKIEVNFNTLVDEQSVLDLVSVEGDSNIDYTINLTENSSGNSKAEIIFNRLLEPDLSYILNVKRGIKSRYASSIESLVGFSNSFATYNDAAFEVLKNEVTADGVYTFKAYKNTNDTANLTAVAAIYQTVEVNGKNYDKLVEMRYIPLDVKSSDKGIFEYEIPLNNADENSQITCTLWSWPNNQKINLPNGNIGKMSLNK